MTIPKQKHIINKKGEPQLITQISVGSDHVIVLTTKGEVYSWECNEKGGIDLEKINKPTRTLFSGLSKNDSIKQISASGNFNIILTNHGKVFSWGDNYEGHCGISNKEFVLKPIEIVIKRSKEEKIVLIDTSSSYSIAYTNQNSIYFWGCCMSEKVKSYVQWIPIKSNFPLHHALFFEKTNIARELMTPDNINQLDSDGQSPLFIACDNGNEEMVKELLQKKSTLKFSKNSYIYHYKTLVDVASLRGYLSIVQILFDYGIKGSYHSIFNAISGGYTDIVIYLLDHQIDLLNVKDDEQNSVLCAACSSGAYDIVKLLLSKGANVNHQNDEDETPLYLTCFSFADYPKEIIDEKPQMKASYIAIVTLLLENQADMHLKAFNNLTALLYATQCVQYSFLKIMLSYEPQLVHNTFPTKSLLHLVLSAFKNHY